MKRLKETQTAMLLATTSHQAVLDGRKRATALTILMLRTWQTPASHRVTCANVRRVGVRGAKPQRLLLQQRLPLLLVVVTLRQLLNVLPGKQETGATAKNMERSCMRPAPKRAANVTGKKSRPPPLPLLAALIVLAVATVGRALDTAMIKVNTTTTWIQIVNLLAIFAEITG